MSEKIAVIIAALGGLTGLSGLVGTILAYRRISKKDSNASMVTNFQSLYDELRQDIGRLRDEQREERKQWSEERKLFGEKIEKLQGQLRDQDILLHKKDITVTQLRGEVNTLSAQLEVYKAMSSTKKEVTVNT